VLGRRIDDNADRGGLGGFDLPFKFSTLLLSFSVFPFPDDCLSSCVDFDVEATGALAATLSPPGLPGLPLSEARLSSLTTFGFLYCSHHSPLKHRSTSRLVVGSISRI